MSDFTCELSSKVRAKRINVLPVGVKVRTADSSYFLYPDVLGLYEKPIFHDSENDIVLNPSLIVEIYSVKTALFDRNDKFIIYQQFESVKEIVFVSQYKPLVQTFYRVNGAIWKCNHTIGLKSSIKFDSIKAKIKLEKIYDRVQFNQ